MVLRNRRVKDKEGGWAYLILFNKNGFIVYPVDLITNIIQSTINRHDQTNIYWLRLVSVCLTNEWLVNLGVV